MLLHDEKTKKNFSLLPVLLHFSLFLLNFFSFLLMSDCDVLLRCWFLTFQNDIRNGEHHHVLIFVQLLLMFHNVILFVVRVFVFFYDCGCLSILAGWIAQ